MPITMKKTLSKFLLGIFLLFNLSYVQAQLDSLQIKMIKALGPEQVQAMLTSVINSSTPENKANFQKAMDMIKLEQPSIATVELKDKTVKFIPIAHAGKKKFYENLTSMVNEHKKMGYVVFYEQLKRSKSVNEVDTLRLKYRKIIGIEPSRKTYSLLTLIYPDIVVQPEYNLLGITETDVNADISIVEFVEQFEKLYGKVELEACDFEAKPGTISSCPPMGKKLDPIILDYRNENLANMVKESKQDKILVIYGANHIKGMMELVQKP